MKEDDERMKKVESAVVFIFITADHKEHEPWDRSFINLSFLTVPRHPSLRSCFVTAGAYFLMGTDVGLTAPAVVIIGSWIDNFC